MKKTIYTVIGYTHEIYKNNWAVYGAYTTRVKAEEKILSLAGEALDGYKFRARVEPEEYGDMTNASILIDKRFGEITHIEDTLMKHIYLDLVQTTLRSGKD